MLTSNPHADMGHVDKTLNETNLKTRTNALYNVYVFCLNISYDSCSMLEIVVLKMKLMRVGKMGFTIDALPSVFFGLKVSDLIKQRILIY